MKIKTSRFSYLLVVLGLLAVGITLSGTEQSIQPDINGTWRVSLKSPGGELPFIMKIGNKGGKIKAAVHNGEEVIPFTRVERKGIRVKFFFYHYDSVLDGELGQAGNTITGKWSRRALHDTLTIMPFQAVREVSQRFKPHRSTSPAHKFTNISGEWQVYFMEKDKKDPAKAIFRQKKQIVTGTFLTTLGDYRYLAGSFENGLLQLSVFDGAHAFLFKARIDGKGRLNGDFWSRNNYHVKWSGKKGNVQMPDPYRLTRLTNNNKKFSFTFPDLKGNLISNGDRRFRDSPLIIYIFGTWCPNCNDEAPFLQELYKQYQSRGLKIIGLANEFTGKFDRDSDMIKRYIKKYRLSWPILLMGIADKEKTAKALKDLDRILAYPTTIFMDRNHQVYRIYTGFNGPGTGKYHKKLRGEFHRIIKHLLKQ